MVKNSLRGRLGFQGVCKVKQNTHAVPHYNFLHYLQAYQGILKLLFNISKYSTPTEKEASY